MLLPAHHASALTRTSWSPDQASLEDGSLWLLGLAGWAAAAAIGVVGWCSARNRPGSRPRARLLLDTALLSGLLLADDLFQLHHPAIPDALGVPPIVVLAAYASLAAALLWSNRHAIVRTDVALLVVTLAFFALWIGAKVAPHTRVTTGLESGAKLCGIAGWVAYVARVALGLPRGAPVSPPRRRSEDVGSA